MARIRALRPVRRSAAVAVTAAVTALAVVALTGAGAVPAIAQTGLPVAPVPTTDAPPVPVERTLQEKLIVDAALRVAKSRGDLLATEKNLADTSDKLAAAERALAETERKLLDARTQVVALRQRLQARAAVVYQNHSDRLGMALSIDHVVNLQAGNHYADAIAVVDNKELDRLAGVIDDLSAQRDAQDATRRDLADARDQLQRRRDDLQAQIDQGSATLDKLGGVPVMGASLLSGAELAAWFKSTGQRARLTGTTTIDDLAQFYVDEGAAEGVRGDLAFAQAVIETGSFGNAIDNNYAGIGACDSCESEMLFPTPRDGVRAQIQLLRNYADPTSSAATLANPPDPTLYGTDPARAAWLFDSFPFKGKAPAWNVMGGGNWATDPLYAGKVLAVYQKMLAFKAGLTKDRLG